MFSGPGLLFRLLLCSVTASPATSLTDDAFRYLDNGVVRLGVDLARGGSIGFFGPSGPPSVEFNQSIYEESN